MNLFQIIAIAAVGLLLVLILAAVGRGWTTRREGLVWSLVFLAAGTAILWPRVTGVIAKVMGIGRGADLLLYCAVVTMMIGFLMTYSRLQRLRRELTLLVRQLAIERAVVNPSLEPSTGSTVVEGAGEEQKPEV